MDEILDAAMLLLGIGWNHGIPAMTLRHWIGEHIDEISTRPSLTDQARYAVDGCKLAWPTLL